ncbi:cytochrome P450 4C1 [Panulirus ornatus]|uniref:cytochrome P450 4C1 n=1 Tax=Panulirus ornatus TaxID=150431 RepID=UPI003A8B5E49
MLLQLLPNEITYMAYIAIVAVTVMWFYKRQQKIWLIEKIPGPKALPVLGNILDVVGEPVELFRNVCGFCDLTTVTRLWLGPVPYCLISQARNVEVILSSQRLLEKSYDYNFLHPWLGTGLLTSTGSKWHRRRKLLTPAFHFKILEDFLEVFNTQSKTLIQNLQKKADGKAFNIFPFITLCTLDIICETAMGCNINAQEDSELDYVQAVYRISKLIQQRMSRPWLHPDVLFKLFGYGAEHDACLKILHDFTNKAIRSRRREYVEAKKKNVAPSDTEIIGKKRRLALLDLLMEYSEKERSLSDEDIREEVDTFMFEGHDTTAAAVNWSLYLLGHHPEIQARVHEELDSLFGDSNRPVSMDELRELKYTENCIKEALRLFPSVPFLGRELKEDVILDNYRVPAGTAIIIAIYCLHRNPEQFPNPEIYDPDRFLPENALKRHPYAYIPFSAGPRNCIGQKFAMMEEKILLSSILRSFRVESVTRSDDLRVQGALILRPETENVVKLFPRV